MRSLSLFLARRLLLSRKSHSVIGVIARISAIAVGVPVAAMVILLAVFNGFEGLVRAMYHDFDPDILISPRTGKVFDTARVDTTTLASSAGVATWSWVLEENALAEYRGNQQTVLVRGVGDRYDRVVPIGSMVREGEYTLDGDFDDALVGQGIAYELGIRTRFSDTLTLYAPRRGTFSALLPVAGYAMGVLRPTGIFVLDADTDGKYLLVPFGFAQRLFDYEGRASAVAVRVAPGSDPERVKEQLEELVGSDFKVETRYEQKASMYRLMRYEKWGIFFIAAMVLLIASCSIVGSLAMLILDKRADIRILAAMGAPLPLIRRIFVHGGLLIGGIGGIGGFLLGVVFCLLQQHFGWIRIPAETFLVESYPVELRIADLFVTVATFAAVCYFITKFTVAKMITRADMCL